MKISVIGTGHVGAATAFALTLRGAAEELVLVNRSPEKAEGEARDLTHAATFLPGSTRVRAGSVDDTADSGVVILTHSVPWDDARHESRLDLAKDNVVLFREWIPPLAAASPDAVLVCVTNPVDVMTWHALALSGFPAGRVVGTGTLIDSARYRALLSEEIGIHPDDIRAYVLGEHGDSQFPLLSTAVTGGERFYEGDLTRRLFDRTVRSGFEVMRLKGYTNWAVATAAVVIAEAVAADARRTLPVSTFVADWGGAGPVCLSVPAVVGAGGVHRVLRPSLSPEETTALRRSAETVRSAFRDSGGDVDRVDPGDG